MTSKLNFTEVRNRLNELSAVDLLTLLLYGETYGEDVENQIAIAQVVLNRARIGGWYGEGLTGATGVILKPFQFECFNENNPALPRLVALSDAPRPSLFWRLRGVAEVVLTGNVRDITNGATHYYEGVVAPSWAKKHVPTAKVGRRAFCREREEKGESYGKDEGY